MRRIETSNVISEAFTTQTAQLLNNYTEMDQSPHYRALKFSMELSLSEYHEKKEKLKLSVV